MKKSAKALIILSASAIAFIVLSVIVFSVASPKHGSRRIDESKAGTVGKHAFDNTVSKISIKSPGYGDLSFKIIADNDQNVEISGEYDDCFKVSESNGTLSIDIVDGFDDYINTEITVHVNDGNLTEIKAIGNCDITLDGMECGNLSIETSGNITVSRANIGTVDLTCTQDSWASEFLSGKYSSVENLNVTSRCDVTIDNVSGWIGNATFNNQSNSNYTIQFIGKRPNVILNPSEEANIALYFSKKTFMPATDQPIKETDRNIADSDYVKAVDTIAVDTAEITSE